MKRKWTNIERLATMIMQMRSEGYSRQQIANALGLKKVQVKNWINRNNRRQKAIPKVPGHRGRPRKRLINETEAMALRIRELEREVELYRSFLQVAGRM
ncbi:MAG TPA: helix-turn-helix domain-containing protein [Ruminiclostridium sp.]|nr:helix-turn-helix domain-containing protein [Ruminiclostridium sp.]